MITCAAPNLRAQPSNLFNRCDGNIKVILSAQELAEIHRKRDRRIFDVAVQNGVEALVLGAFGCGAFYNDPVTVADVMLSLVNEYSRSFKVIEFAVYCPPSDDTNFRIFDAKIQ